MPVFNKFSEAVKWLSDWATSVLPGLSSEICRKAEETVQAASAGVTSMTAAEESAREASLNATKFAASAAAASASAGSAAASAIFAAESAESAASSAAAAASPATASSFGSVRLASTGDVDPDTAEEPAEGTVATAVHMKLANARIAEIDGKTLPMADPTATSTLDGSDTESCVSPATVKAMLDQYGAFGQPISRSRVNLNTLYKNGTYYCMTTCYNLPGLQEGLLVVQAFNVGDSAVVWQTFNEIGERNIYMRKRNTLGIWTAWDCLTDIATTSKDGLMSMTDKAKLDRL